MSGHLFRPSDSPPPGVDASASCCTLQEKSIQAPVGAPSQDNEGESATPLSLFFFVGGGLSRELSNDGGFREGIC